jgi:Flp pilus assembly CpaE family ATPase
MGAGGKLAGLIPEDTRNATAAANQGKPLAAIDRNGPAAIAIARLVSQVVITAQPPAKGVLARMPRWLGGRP